MNILIISNFFTPQVHIASFRMEAFAKYLHLVGHNVIVLTEDSFDHTEFLNGSKIIYVKDPAKLSRISFSDKDSVILHKIKALINIVYNQIYLDKRKYWRKKVYDIAKSAIKENSIDIILSSYGYLSPHLLGLRLKRENPSIKWIVDMRDEMASNPFFSKFIRMRLKRIEAKILNNADLVLSVSKPILDIFRLNCRHQYFLEIKNGYDFEEDRQSLFQKQFTLSYVGSFYGIITPNNLLQALVDLKRNKLINQDFVFKIVGNRKPINIPLEIKENVLLYNRVSHDQAIEEIKKSDVLLIIHPTGRKGVYTGKLFDYLAINRTILALADPNDVIADMLNETNAGFIIDNADIEGIKKSVLKCFTLWKNREVLYRNWEVIDKYSRKEQVNILQNYMLKNNWIR